MIAIGSRPDTKLERELTQRLEEPNTSEREKYLAGSIRYLRERLAAAEDAVVVFSWCAADHSDRGNAAHELWVRWCHVSGFSSSPKEFPHLTDELIKELSAQREATRKVVLSKLFEGQA